MINCPPLSEMMSRVEHEEPREKRKDTQGRESPDPSTTSDRTPSNPPETKDTTPLSLDKNLDVNLHAPEQGLHQTSSIAAAERSNSRPGLPVRSASGAETIRAYPFYRAKSAAQFDESRAASQASLSMPMPVSMTSIGRIVEKPDYSEVKLVLALVGLPARGKSSIAVKLLRYLTWLEYKVKIFNVGELRRKKNLEEEERQGIQGFSKRSSFDHVNPRTFHVAEKIADESLDNLISWLKAGGNIGIHDARNATRARRARIASRVFLEPNFKLVFLESNCDDPAVIAANIALKASVDDPDYSGLSHEEVVEEYTHGIKQCEAVYETMEQAEWEGMPEETEEERLKLVGAAAEVPDPSNNRVSFVTKEIANSVSYMKITDTGGQLEMFRMGGDLLGRIAYYLMNLHLEPRSIFLSRHGECLYNVESRIGGDVGLSRIGEEYAQALPALIFDAVGDQPIKVWTSTLRRTIQTARHLPPAYPQQTWKSLDEIDAGVCDGMTYKEIEESYPGDFAHRDRDKFNYRYSGGESYRDIVVRLERVILQLEREKNILVIGHQAVLRCLYAYFHGNISHDDVPYIDIPLHTIIKLTPTAYGCDEERYRAPIEASSTHRPKPKLDVEFS
ncbi:Fructose-2,6-bisphosphatase [Tulasnella sp. 424]|nr:Fructose-2,6-bisphosphatase [Tulasnella sp. 424]KAG8975142.1 Fructose-2,6-bisphosphatase [Tulasnella sp. 425]